MRNLEKYGRLPGGWFIATPFKPYPGHDALDIGFKAGGPTDLPYCAWKSGKVIEIKTTAAGGNYVTVEHGQHEDGLYEYTQVCHLANNTTVVKVGMDVAQGQQLARMGTTGTMSSGPHFHFVLWRSKSPTFAGAVRADRVNPAPWTYIYPGQTFMAGLPIKPIIALPKAAQFDENKYQIKILADNVNCRVGPGTEFQRVGFLYSKEYYDILPTPVNEKWYQLAGTPLYVCGDPAWSIITYPIAKQWEIKYINAKMTLNDLTAKLMIIEGMVYDAKVLAENSGK